MKVVDIQTAAKELTQLVRAIELGNEAEIVIARDGRPVAKLAAVDAAPSMVHLGVAKGKFELPNDLDVRGHESTK